MEFNIIKRDPVWLQLNKVYTFTYQVDNKPKQYKVDLIYINIQNKNRFVFLDTGNLKQNEHLSDNFLNNRTEFIKEIEKWQKGGSYRKTHPIAYSNYDKLINERKELNRRLDEINKEIESEKRKSLENKINEYQSDIDKKSLDKFEKELSSLIGNSDYSVVERIYQGDPILLLYDEVKQKYRAKIEFYSDQVSFTDVPNEMLFKLFL